MFEQEDPIGKNPYYHFLDSFLLNLYSLKSFANNVRPVLVNEIIRKRKFGKVEEMPVELLIELLQQRKYGLLEDPNLEELGIENLEKILDEKHGVILLDKSRFKIYGPHKSTTSKAINDYRSRHNQLGILYQSTLISLVIYFEMLIGTIIKHRLVKHPKASDIDNKVLTIEEIRKLGSFENAEQYLIEQDVETLIRKKYLDWIDYFKTNMKLKLDNIAPLNDKVIEIIQRRNLFVHNEGIVNNIYLSNINTQVFSEGALGEKLSISLQYIDESIDTIRHIGVLIGLEYWRMMEKESSERIRFINNKGMDFMLGNEWELTRDIYRFNLFEKSINSKSKTVAQINYWLSMKRLGKFSEIEKELKSSDFSDKTREFQICYYAILGNTEEMFRIIPKGLEFNEITIDDLIDWPVFDEYRDDERFLALVDVEKENDEEKITKLDVIEI
ncbi:hypothetical protein [Paenibacillus sp. FSL R10-2778]|uniref:hypothetical protein n=1 Tax=Paenibacillus sp. FSL R10-2778 TaxID=2954659 RepID=UPI00315891D3